MHANQWYLNQSWTRSVLFFTSWKFAAHKTSKKMKQVSFALSLKFWLLMQDTLPSTFSASLCPYQGATSMLFIPCRRASWTTSILSLSLVERKTFPRDEAPEKKFYLVLLIVIKKEIINEYYFREICCNFQS